MSIARLSFCLVLATLLATACEEVQGPPGGIATGSAAGFVKLYDEYGFLLQEKQGVTVTVSDTDPVVSATTNASGRYQLDDLETGTYEIEFSKDGFATYTYFFKFIAGPVTNYLGFVDMVERSSTVVSGLEIGYDQESWMYLVRCTLQPEPLPDNPINIRYFIGDSQNVSSSNYNSTVLDHFDRLYNDMIGSSPGQIEYLSDELTDALSEYATGTTVYIIAHGCPENADPYEDYNGNTVFPGINTTGSNIVTCTIPGFE